MKLPNHSPGSMTHDLIEVLENLKNGSNEHGFISPMRQKIEHYMRFDRDAVGITYFVVPYTEGFGYEVTHSWYADKLTDQEIIALMSCEEKGAKDCAMKAITLKAEKKEPPTWGLLLCLSVLIFAWP